jgi:hypothetical protein
VQQQQDSWDGPGLPDAGALPASAPLRPEFVLQEKKKRATDGKRLGHEDLVCERGELFLVGFHLLLRAPSYGN